MNNGNVLDAIYKQKLIAIIRGVKPALMTQTVGALIKGGISVLEVTFDNKSKDGVNDTAESLILIKNTFGNRICLGAGTVLNEDQVNMAKEAGVSFIISPNTDLKVISKTKSLGLISIPGALTPTEILAAYNAGADIVKLFPAGILGLGYIKAVAAPLSHIPYMAVGGITPDNIKSFFDTGICAVGIGSNLVDTIYIKNNDFDKITDLARLFVKRVKEGDRDDV